MLKGYMTRERLGTPALVEVKSCEINFVAMQLRFLFARLVLLLFLGRRSWAFSLEPERLD